MSDFDTTDDVTGSSSFVSRRKVIAGTSIASGAAGLAVAGLSSVTAVQDATPSADATPHVSATPAEEAALPAVPPEIETYAADWPLAQGDLAATLFCLRRHVLHDQRR